MLRTCVGLLAIVSVCGQSLGQVAAPPTPAPKPGAQVPVGERGAVVEVAGKGERVDLRPNWRKDDMAKFDFEITTRWTARTTEEEGAKKGGQLYRQEGRLVRRVVSVDDNGVTLSFMIERLHIQVSSGTEVIHYDSDFGDNPERKNELTEPVKATVHRPVTVRVDTAGKLVSVEGNEDAPPDPNKPEGTQTQIMKGVLGTTVIRNLWKPLYGLEKKNLDSRIGDKWTTEEVTSDAAMGTFGLVLHHELKELKDGVAKIETTADVDFTSAIGKSVPHSTLTGSTVTGAVEWDVKRGALKTWTTSQEMKLDRELAGQKQKFESNLATSFKRVEPGTEKEAAKGSTAGAAGQGTKP